MSKIKAYLLEMRIPFITISVIPVLIGTAAAKASGAAINVRDFLLALFGFVLIHLGANVLNDFFDNENGTDVENSEFVPPFTGGSRLIQSGALRPAEVLIEGLLLMLAAGALFIPLARAHGNMVTWFFLFAVICGMFYTAPPFKWAHRGLGEILIFLNFGPVIVFCSWFVQTGTLSLIPLLISLPSAFLATAILDINEFPDFNADKNTGKKNLVVRMGRKAARFGYLFLICGAYISLLALIVFKYTHPSAVFAVLAAPLSVLAFTELMKNYESPRLLGKACGMTILAHLAAGIAMAITIWFL